MTWMSKNQSIVQFWKLLLLRMSTRQSWIIYYSKTTEILPRSTPCPWSLISCISMVDNLNWSKKVIISEILIHAREISIWSWTTCYIFMCVFQRWFWYPLSIWPVHTSPSSLQTNYACPNGGMNFSNFTALWYSKQV